MSGPLFFIIVCFGFLIAVVLGWYFYIVARNKERMALIERDKDVSEIYSRKGNNTKIPWLKIGLLLTGIGFGFCVAIGLYMIPQIRPIFSDVGPALPIALMILFGGLGIILGHYLEKSSE